VALPASCVSALVCESLQPLQEIYVEGERDHCKVAKGSRTQSAGLVFVALDIASDLCKLLAVLINPVTELNTLPISPRAYEVAADIKLWPASEARFGSLILPSVEY
jgi:hypothetical protein